MNIFIVSSLIFIYYAYTKIINTSLFRKIILFQTYLRYILFSIPIIIYLFFPHLLNDSNFYLNILKDITTKNFNINNIIFKLLENVNNQKSFSSKNIKNKRNVSESKKKFVAASQQWKCNDCNNLLDATYEIDHKIPLYKGGNNEINNLSALCRNCHGKKTLKDKLFL